MVPINYLAVVVAAIAAMVVGFIWYGPLFGKKWSELMGWGPMTPEKMAEMQKAARTSYAITFGLSLVMAYILAHNITFASAYLSEGALSAGLQGAFWNWLGFIVPVTMGSVLWDKKPWTLWFINAGYWLANLIVMGLIIALW